MKLVIFSLLFLFAAISNSEANSYQTMEDTLLIVPVVVHVVYSSPVQNISDYQIHSQIEALNKDFRKKNEDVAIIDPIFKNFVADINIEFRLAHIDLNGNHFTGITRTATSHGPFGDNDIYFTNKGGLDIWDSHRYLNVYVCDLVTGLSGFSSSPGFISDIDGVVVDYEYFGIGGTAKPPFNKGRTLTHEIGHWLGLKHIWGTGGCESDDGIHDTPVQDAAVGCSKSYSSCGEVNMVQNFMGYGVDSCLLFFTQGQKEVIRNCLTGYRKDILENSSYVLNILPVSSNSLLISYMNRDLSIYIGSVTFDKANIQLFTLLGEELVNKSVNVSDGNLIIHNISLPYSNYYLIVLTTETYVYKRIVLLNF
ncbi:MAG TPA: M43 family zinc metalloprotease [Cytophagaceae bacterium]